MHFNDDIFRLLQEFIDANQDQFSSIEETVEAFMTQHNISPEAEDQWDESEPLLAEEESMLLVRKASRESNRTKQKKMLKQALKLWPDNYEAELLLMDDDLLEQLKTYVTIEKRERAKWLKTDQAGWINWEERHYWKFKGIYAEFLLEVGLLSAAEEQFQDLFAYNDMDNLGARYGLMSIYARTYQWDKAKRLLEQVPEDAHDDMLLVPLICVSVLTQHTDYAYDLMQTLKELNPELGKLFRHEAAPIEMIVKLGHPGSYNLYSLESLCVALYPLIPLLVGAAYLYPWLKHAYKSKAKRLPQTKSATNVIEFPNAQTKPATDPLAGIAVSPREILENIGLTTFAAFEKVTEAEVAKLRGIGPQTMKQLKANQVTFKIGT